MPQLALAVAGAAIGEALTFGTTFTFLGMSGAGLGFAAGPVIGNVYCPAAAQLAPSDPARRADQEETRTCPS